MARELTIVVNVDTGQAVAQLKEVDGAIKQVEVSTNKATDATKKQTTAFGGLMDKFSSYQGIITKLVGAAGIGMVARMTADYALSIDRLAKTVPLSTNALQDLDLIAKLNRRTLAELAGAVMNMTETVGQGKKGARAAIEGLGLDFDELRKLSPEETFKRINRALVDLKDPYLRAAYAQDIYKGSADAVLASLDDLNDKGLKRIPPLSADAIKAINDVSRQWTMLKEALKAGAMGTITVLYKVATDREGGMFGTGQSFGQMLRTGATMMMNGPTGSQWALMDTWARREAERVSMVPPGPAGASGMASMYANRGIEAIPLYTGLESSLREVTRAGHGAARSLSAVAAAPWGQIPMTSGFGYHAPAWNETDVTSLVVGQAPLVGRGGYIDMRAPNITSPGLPNLSTGINWGGMLQSGGAMALQSIFSGGGVGRSILGAGGSLLGSLIPGLGPIGGMLGGAVGGWLGGLFGGNKEYGAVKDQRAAFEGQFGGSQGLIEAVSKAYADLGRTGTEAQAALKAFWNAKDAKAYEAAVRTITDALDAQKNKQAEIASLEAQIAALRDQEKVTWQEMASLAQKYGIEVSGLGQNFQQLRINDITQEILSDYERLIAGGADANAVLRGMADEISNVVQTSQQFGTTIPQNLRPLIEALAASGELVDANGQKITDLAGLKWGDPVATQAEIMAQAIDDLVTKLDELIGALRGDLPAAVDAGMRDAQGRVDARGPIVIPYRYQGDDFDPDAMPGYAGGTRGRFVDFGAGTPVMLHGRERVMTEAEAGASIVVNVDASGAFFDTESSRTRLGQTVAQAVMQTLMGSERLSVVGAR